MRSVCEVGLPSDRSTDMAHGRRALRLAELGMLAALGVCGAGCQMSALTATGAEALRTARLPCPPSEPATEPAPGPAPLPTGFDKELLAPPPPTVRGVNPGMERIPERRTESI